MRVSILLITAFVGALLASCRSALPEGFVPDRDSFAAVTLKFQT